MRLSPIAHRRMAEYVAALDVIKLASKQLETDCPEVFHLPTLAGKIFDVDVADEAVRSEIRRLCTADALRCVDVLNKRRAAALAGGSA